MSMIEIFLAIGLLLALCVWMIADKIKPITGWLFALYPASMFGWGLSRIGQQTSSSHTWLPQLNISFGFNLDAWSLFFWLLISGIGTLIFIYAGGYMKKELGRMLSFLSLFMVAMLGMVAAKDLISTFVFWEMTSISSFLLIGFNHLKTESRKSALQALAVTGFGGLILLAGFVALGVENNSFQFTEITSASPLAIILITLGCMTKSAQFPFHFWLPNAMAAPTPVSAYLHSATMVKAGVFLLAKLSPVFGTQEVIAYIGGFTLLLGSILAIGEKDLKRILAWSTVAALGSMVMLIGVGTEKALEALVITVLAHACYKGCLFMVAGTIDLSTGTRDITTLKGLAKNSPLLALPAILAGISFAGIPFLALGFVKKEAMLGAVEENIPLLSLVAISAIFGVVATYNVAIKPFFGQKPENQNWNKPNFGLLTGPLVLSIIGIAGALAISLPDTSLLIGKGFLEQVTSQLAKHDVHSHLALWHGVNTPLIVSLSAVLLGSLLIPTWSGIHKSFTSIRQSTNLSLELVFQKSFQFIQMVGKHLAGLVTKNSPRVHLLTYFITVIALFGIVFIIQPFLVSVIPNPLVTWDHGYELVIVAFAVIATAGVILARTRLGGVAVLGIVGVAVTLTFLTFSAPDLALTQLLIEVLSVVLFVLLFSHLPRFANISDRFSRIRDAAIAAAFGGCMTLLLIGVLSLPHPTKVKDYYAKSSYKDAHGKNVVNTIIVDYRGLDTLGEITVLCVAALGVHTLIRFRPVRRRKTELEDLA